MSQKRRKRCEARLEDGKHSACDAHEERACDRKDLQRRAVCSRPPTHTGRRESCRELRRRVRRARDGDCGCAGVGRGRARIGRVRDAEDGRRRVEEAVCVVAEHDVVVVARRQILDVDVDAAHRIGYCKGRA